MKSYRSKQELIAAIDTSYDHLVQEYSDIDESLFDTRREGVDKTPREIIAYQIGWLNLVLQWDVDEQAGSEVITPTPEYKWNNLGGLYRSFYEKTQDISPAELLKQFAQSKEAFTRWIQSLDNATLFEPSQRKWATTRAMWPVWKWIHINSVAPFTNFRIKIRKWKRLV